MQQAYPVHSVLGASHELNRLKADVDACRATNTHQPMTHHQRRTLTTISNDVRALRGVAQSRSDAVSASTTARAVQVLNDIRAIMH